LDHNYSPVGKEGLLLVTDVVVIGGGHNGLSCAAYLAKAGRHVVVVESQGVIGGFSSTEETVKEAPGFQMNTGAIDMVFSNSDQSVVDELDLTRYGLRVAIADPWGSYLNPDGASIALWRDPTRSISEIRRFSMRDAAAFERLNRLFTDLWLAVRPYLQDHPTRPSLRTLGQMCIHVAKGRRSFRPLLRMLLSSPEQLIEEEFERGEVKALMANLASWSMLPLAEGGSGGVLAMCSTYFNQKSSRPIGGTGSFPAAMARCVEAHGGIVRLNARVISVLVSPGGAAEGVELVNGERIMARHVVGAIDPQRLVGNLVPSEHVPHRTKKELQGLNNLRWNIGVFKSDAALSRRPELVGGRSELWNGLLFLGPTLEYIKRAQLQSAVGQLPDAYPQWTAIPSVVDRTQVPPGSTGESLFMAMATVPVEIQGSQWADEAHKFNQRAFGFLEEHAPGVTDAVIGTFVRTPDDYRAIAGKGNLYHADMTLAQLGPWRPTPSLSGYRTPVENLWHSGAGAHPVGGLTGWSGRTTARIVDAALRGSQQKPRGRALLTARR
jgi:phytoene dehydrogenase-like protein